MNTGVSSLLAGPGSRRPNQKPVSENREEQITLLEEDSKHGHRLGASKSFFVSGDQPKAMCVCTYACVCVCSAGILGYASLLCSVGCGKEKI